MSDQLLIVILTGAAISAVRVSGVFMAFSDFVMKSLHAAEPTVGVEAMQQINRNVYRSLFIILLLGLAPTSAALSAYALMHATGAASVLIMAGGLIYLIGVFSVTACFNVPMNKRLDAMSADAVETRLFWNTYATQWTRWNHVRSAASGASAACYMIGASLL